MTRKHKGKRRPSADPIWAEVKRKGHLSKRQLLMAQHLGLNPAKLLGNIASAKQEHWKAAPGIWIEGIWAKRYGGRESEWPAALRTAQETEHHEHR